MNRRVALAVAAHPDDIEFMMAGTLLLLREAGYETHYLNVANGSCGSLRENAAKTVARRRRESRNAASILGATHHASLADDIGIFYEPLLLAKLAAVVRGINPSILLTHSLDDYMEDHMITARLAVTAAFIRGMPNYATRPRRAPVTGDVTVYHALPHGLRDQLGRRVVPESFVDVGAVLPTKRAALAAHESQMTWLNASQKMNSYLDAMEQTSRRIGGMSGSFAFAEAWRRHNPIGYCPPEADPLQAALGRKYCRNPPYRRWLDRAG
jgi:LmbE family N-acetylglucosaminyl deacetylase